MTPIASDFSSQVQRPNSFPLGRHAVRRVDVKSASDAHVAKRAYAKYVARGCVHGFDKEDWTAASRELIAETFGQ